MNTLMVLSCGLDAGYDLSSMRVLIFGGSTPRKDEVREIQERLPTLKIIIQCAYLMYCCIQTQLITN